MRNDSCPKMVCQASLEGCLEGPLCYVQELVIRFLDVSRCALTIPLIAWILSIIIGMTYGISRMKTRLDIRIFIY